MKKIILLPILLFLLNCQGQNTLLPMTQNVPLTYSAFNDIAGWWRADSFTGSSGSYSLTDLSGHGNSMVQQAGTLTAGTGTNSKAKFTGNSTALLSSNLVINNFPITTFCVFQRANNATCGFFGESTVAKFWHGYESTNQNYVYSINAAINTTSEAGSTAIYTARVGWGSRMFLLNGTIQADHTVPNAIQSTFTGTLGSYHGLNGDFYECLVWTRTLSLSDIDEIHTYLNTRYGLSAVLWSSYTPVSTLWIGGQSNASGRAPKTSLTSPYNTAQTNVNIYHGSWQTLDESANNNMYGDDATSESTKFGFEASIGHDYIGRVGGSVYIYKYAVGGTPLANMGSLYWDAMDNSSTPHNGFKLYPNFSMYNWIEALKAFQTASQKPIMKSIFWFQGENDATSSTPASNYQQNEINFFTALRPELGTDPEAPTFIMRLPSWQTGEPYLSTVRTAQANAVSSLSNSTLINTDSYTALVDGVHLDAASQLSLGTTLAALIP